MKTDKLIEYIFIIILCFILFFDLFVSNIFYDKSILAIFLGIYVIVCRIFMKSSKIDNVNKKIVIFLMTSFGAFYVVVLYITGIFVGFYRNATGFSLYVLCNRILPLVAIIIFSEIIRGIFVARGNKKSIILMTIALILIDITIYINLYNFSILEDVLALIGYVCLSSISMNLLGNYNAKRYGIISNIVYRIITTIYIYIFSILPDIYLFFQSTFRIVYPYIIYLIIDNLFEKDKFRMAARDKKMSWINLLIGLVTVLCIVLLISCKFKYGVLVVGSSSMTNSVNKGDAVFFEQYNKQTLEEGQIIIFQNDNVRTIHRIEDIQTLNGEKVYYTKGDNNQQRDDGYRKENDIVGIVDFKISYIGWPTVWLNDMFKK